MTKRKFLSMAAILAVLIAAYGYYMYNKPVSGLKHVKSDMTVSAYKLLSDYEENEAKANYRYLDKILTVTGTVSSIKRSKELIIHLNTESDLSEVICKVSNLGNTTNLKAGDKIEIKGHCTGYLMDVLLVNSIITKII